MSYEPVAPVASRSPVLPGPLPVPGVSPEAEQPRVVLLDSRSDRRSVMAVIVDLALGEGSVVGHASTLADALRITVSNSADTVLLDIEPPAGNGAAMISALRSANPALRIVVCTFSNDAALQRETLAAGADLYLVKPVSVGEFRSIRRLVGGAALAQT